jgi:hypothetical protein
MPDEVRARISDQIADRIDAFNRGDLDAMLVDYTATSRYRIAREHPEARECVGRDEVATYYRSWRDHLDDVRIEVTDVEVESGFCLLALRFLGRPAGGAELSVPAFLLLEFDDGLQVISGEEFLDGGEAHRRFATVAGL